MSRVDEPDAPFDGWGEADEGSRRPDYDPLFDDWETDRPAAPQAWDELFAMQPVLAQSDEDLYAFSRYDAEAAAYPDRTQPQYAERLTELQRRLRAGTVTLPAPERRWAVTIRELAETLILAALIFLAVRASFQNFRVEGASMQPSLQNGEYLIVNKLEYAEIDLGMFDWLPFFDSGQDPVHHLWGKPTRGDVIVFRAPTSIQRDFIKRIIGVPGDTVDIDNGSGHVAVNGHVLEEPYIQGKTDCGSAQTCTWTVPAAGSDEAQDTCGSDECYFVMGDNRQNSSDSRQGWMVPKENIIGKALITYWEDGSPSFDLAPNRNVGQAEEAQ